MLKSSEMTDLLDAITTPLLLVKAQGDSVNHAVCYINPAFNKEIGYTQEEIPDKNSWWQLAYPDPLYRKVVESQWELLFQEACEKGNTSISLEVDIQTKNHGERRFRVYAEIQSNIVPDCYVVMFANPELDAKSESPLAVLLKQSHRQKDNQ